jgi:hypothetical protein
VIFLSQLPVHCRYAPPQQYVMSTQTPRPPPPVIAAFLSPVLWRMENPDRFDMCV